MVAYQLTHPQQAYYKIPSQRMQTYFGLTDSFVMTQDIKSTDPKEPVHQVREEFFWNPMVIMGPNLLAWTGEQVPLWGGDSYTKGPTYITGDSNFNWLVHEGAGHTYVGPYQLHTFSSPGLYTVDLTVTHS